MSDSPSIDSVLPALGYTPPKAQPPAATSISSGMVDQIITALAAAVPEIVAPAKNQTATVVSRRTGSTFQYSYADLASILAAIREPLARQGIIVIHQVEDRRLTVRLMHSSGQWLGSWISLKPSDEGPQAFASALTAYRRQLTLCLVGLAPSDDDDANLYEGNKMTTGARTNARWDTSDGDGGDPLLVEIAKAKEGDVGHGVVLLEGWKFHRMRVEQLRRAGDPGFDQIVNAFAAVLNGTLGSAVAAIWKGWMVATTMEHHRALQEKLDGEWAPTMARFREAEPAAFQALTRHINDRWVQIQADAKAEVKKPPTPPAFSHRLTNGTGDILGEIYTDPERFCLALETLSENTPTDQLVALLEYNSDGIVEAERGDVKSAVILKDLMDEIDNRIKAAIGQAAHREPEIQQPAVDLTTISPVELSPQTYLQCVENALAQLTTPEQVTAWIGANRPIYTDRELVEINTQLKVLRAVAGRCRDLGMEPPK